MKGHAPLQEEIIAKNQSRADLGNIFGEGRATHFCKQTRGRNLNFK